MGGTDRADLSGLRGVCGPAPTQSGDPGYSTATDAGAAPTLRLLFQRKEPQARLIHMAYRTYGYRLAEIADHLGVHAATVSRRLKQAEQVHV